MPTLPSNTPRTRNAEADRERLLSEPDSGDYRYHDDDSEPAQPDQTASTSADSANAAMGADEESGVKPEGRRGDGWARNIAFIGAAASSLFVFHPAMTVSTWVTILSNDPVGYGWFAFHPPAQTLALSCFTYGIMTLQPTCQPKTKAAGFIRHQTAVFYFGFPLVTFGTLAAALYKISQGYPHFQTWHATFGLISMIWILVQVFIGAGSVWNGGSLFGGGMKAKAVWKYHRLSGYILFTLMLVTAHLGGGWSFWGNKYTSDFVRFAAYTIAPALIVIGIWSRVRPSKMKFF